MSTQLRLLIASVAVTTFGFSAMLPIASAQWGGGGGGGFDMTGWLRRLDQNENGKIDPDEMEGRSGDFVRRMAERADIKLDRAVDIEDFAKKLQKAREDEQERGDRDRDDRDRDRDRDRGRDDNRYEARPLVPGFGEPIDGLELPPGFDVVPGANVDLTVKYEQKVIDYVDNIYDRYDKNENGQLDADEWGDVRWSSDPNESDLNQDGILTKEEFCERMVARWGSGRLVVTSTSSGSSSRSSSSSSSSSSENVNERTRNYAASLIRLYDKDKNGTIDKQEQESMRGDWSGADSNNDGKLDEREIAARLSNYGRDSGGGSSRSSWGRSSDDGDDGRRSYAATSNGDRKSYRMSTPDERLPKGLPSWFTQYDSNGDGQVQMSEYAATWSDSRASEFLSFDHNSDGFITPAEALEGPKEVEEDSVASRESSRGSSSSRESSTSSGFGSRPSFGSRGSESGGPPSFGSRTPPSTGGSSSGGPPSSGFGYGSRSRGSSSPPSSGSSGSSSSSRFRSR